VIWGGGETFEHGSVRRVTAPISVQLYSLRAEAAADFEKVLRRLGEIGFVGVEPAGLHGMDPARFVSVIEESGLRVSSAHVTLPVGDAANAVLDEQEAIGNTLLIAGGGPADFADADAVKGTAERFNEASANAARRGMKVGYHNHWWEFDHDIDGQSPYSLLQQVLDPAVFLEIDIYWVVVGGRDPADVIAEGGDRVRLLHVKDGPLDPPSPMTAVGAGKVDVPRALGAAAACEWHVVELDACATDMFEAIEASHRYLVGNGLSRGG